jgi:hypothetical protein
MASTNITNIIPLPQDDKLSVKQSFESFIVEFKEKRQNVISIMKIVLEQQKVN